MKKSKNKIKEAQIYVGDVNDAQLMKDKIKADDKLYVLPKDDMSKTELPTGVSETEENVTDTPMVVEYHKDKEGEKPFKIGDTKWQYVWAKYPNGKIDIGVYRYGHDLVYGYDWFKNFIINKPTDLAVITAKTEIGEDVISPTTTSSVSTGSQNSVTHDFQKDVDLLFQKMNTGPVKAALSKINTPVEKYETIAKFSELIGVPREKLGQLISDMKNLSATSSELKKESVVEKIPKPKNPKITKKALAEHVMKLNKNNKK